MLAVDLSLTSLSYAVRKTRELGLQNIAYAQADILKLGAIGRSFDLIESSGVLHHLADPAQGWRVLLSLLRPGGFMHIGLYSVIARADVRAGAQLSLPSAATAAAPTTSDAVARRFWPARTARRCRTSRNIRDFFTTSECRDLLFHVQEHQFTIPEIAAFLRANGLRFIGFGGQPLQRLPQTLSARPSRRPISTAGMFSKPKIRRLSWACISSGCKSSEGMPLLSKQQRAPDQRGLARDKPGENRAADREERRKAEGDSAEPHRQRNIASAPGGTTTSLAMTPASIAIATARTQTMSSESSSMPARHNDAEQAPDLVRQESHEDQREIGRERAKPVIAVPSRRRWMP